MPCQVNGNTELAGYKDQTLQSPGKKKETGQILGEKSDKYLNINCSTDVLLSNCSNSNHIGEILTCLVSSTKAEDSFW